MTEQLTEPGADAGALPALTGPIRIPWAPVPKVNLLPLEIVEKRRFRQIQIGLASAVFVALLLGTFGTFSAQRSVTDANDDVTAAQARVNSLTIQQSRYSAVPRVSALVDAATTARTLAMNNEVLWYRYLNDLDGARPAGVDLTGLQITMNSSAAATGSGNPLATAGLGTVTFTGQADLYGEISAWLDAVNKIVGLSSSTLTTATKSTTTGTSSLTFTSGAFVDPDALSDRYAKKAG